MNIIDKFLHERREYEEWDPYKAGENTYVSRRSRKSLDRKKARDEKRAAKKSRRVKHEQTEESLKDRIIARRKERDEHRSNRASQRSFRQDSAKSDGRRYEGRQAGAMHREDRKRYRDSKVPCVDI